MSRRALGAVGAVAALGLTAVGLAALVDRTPSAAAPLPGFGGGAVPAPEAVTAEWAAAGPDCDRGDPSCLAAVVDEMTTRVDALGCAHAAPFAFTYQEMSRGVHDAVERPGFFVLPDDTVRADARFADLYFQAFDNWVGGREEDVPPAWRVAFGAADDGRANAAVNLLLGMNAHISRDLPYVVADVASWQAEAASGEPGDFARINDVIAMVRGPMLLASAQRYDPTLEVLDSPLPALLTDPDIDLIATWRDQALARGLRLARARTDAEREAVETEIEQSSLATAVVLLDAGTAHPWPLTPAERDEYCAAHVGPGR